MFIVRKKLEQTLPKAACPGHAVVGKVCLVTSPKDSLCLHLVVIDYNMFVALPNTACRGRAGVS